MRKPIARFVPAIAFVVTYLAFCAGLGAQTAPAGQQQFLVLQSEALTVPFQSLASEQAKCAISGNGNFATMRCQPPPATAKASYHYVAILVVDQQGMAYGIACHQSLVDLWCKRMNAGVAVQGSFDAAGKSLLIADGSKVHSYQALTSAFVGPVQPGQPIPSAKRGKPGPSQSVSTTAQPSQSTAGAKDTATDAGGTASLSKPGANEPAAAGVAPATSNFPGACGAATASCTTFVSQPAGADIYVDGKFVGSTPSSLALAPGSHEIRIQADKFKPWTRMLESSAGSTVTVHAALAKK